MAEFFVCLVVILICNFFEALFGGNKNKKITPAEQKRRDEAFDAKIRQLKAEGKKVTYYNRNTGTISSRDRNGQSESHQVYKGYNSHYKETKK